jgi:hypothetical protein
MNIDDPKLTAYALNALPAEEKERCELDVVADEELWREAELTAAFAEKLRAAFTTETNARLSAAHWRGIFAEAGVEPPLVKEVPVESARRFPLWALPAAAGVMFGAVISSLAITWGDRPPTIAGSVEKPRTLERPTEVAPPVAGVVGVSPSAGRVENVARVAKAPAKVPRPTVPPVAALPISANAVAARPQPQEFAGATTDDSPMEELIPDAPEVDEPGVFAVADEPVVDEPIAGVPVHSVQSTAAMPYFPGRNFARTEAPAPIPKPVAAPVPARVPEAPVAAATVTLPAATVAEFSKKPGTSVFAFNNRASSNPNTAPKNAGSNKSGKDKAAGAVGVAAADIEMDAQLNSLRLGTLGDVQKVLDYHPSIVGMVGAGVWSVGAGIPFSIPNRPDLMVNVVLDNDGLPLWITPTDTEVIEISTPYSIPSHP